MFKKILVANRGEIACRIMRTARAMGIKTVAVFSEADAEGKHVLEADEAVAIGPSPPSRSYLDIAAVVAAVKATGAEAVHPGFGFLSENATFAKALDDAGVVFIGPPTAAVAAMGDKVESKKLAKAAGINVIPGHIGIVKDGDEAVAIARSIGYPVMIKASAGGGGKGMRIARDDDECRDGFRGAANEARNSFGDDRLFLERFVDKPRHIEIQVLADAHGNTVHLGERECSIQRRHQKVIEEAPSPFLDAKTRAAMGAQAVTLARAVGYRSAGTVEFIVDGERNFYFLEMNTRLQVEHPVTELIMGLDLVELMIRIAAGEPLPFKQAQIKAKGWAVEARVYAEDPERGFLPSTGRLVRYRPPVGEGIRIDDGVYEGAEISSFYDPMIGKLCAHGATRAEAIGRLAEAIDGFVIRGLSHNLPFLGAVLRHPRFAAGDLDTLFIEQEFGRTFQGNQPSGAIEDVLLAVGAMVQARLARRESGRGEAFGSWVVRYEGRSADVDVELDGDRARVWSKGRDVVLDGPWTAGQTVFRGTYDGQPVVVQAERSDGTWRIVHGGAVIRAKVLSRRAAELLARMPPKAVADTSRFLLSPMPGLVVALHVADGDVVKVGQPLAVIDAMKMENVLRAERDGRIAKVRVPVGASLAVDQVILEFDDTP
ncbi:MAG: acetyl/propionyl/methylcrotonyl-CoA carboxylase subunit alpha [Alphaproteobacteria bacterium]|nr:acetyl/propionyl/methylcrotonyl-CoA carboxylase subunit alpha [Alphaproteobacteria bacterium]